jgi:hypothetical protein
VTNGEYKRYCLNIPAMGGEYKHYCFNIPTMDGEFKHIAADKTSIIFTLLISKMKEKNWSKMDIK